MTKDEALDKDDTLSRLREDVLRLSPTVILVKGEPLPMLVNRADVLQLITKYFRS